MLALGVCGLFTLILDIPVASECVLDVLGLVLVLLAQLLGILEILLVLVSDCMQVKENGGPADGAVLLKSHAFVV